MLIDKPELLSPAGSPICVRAAVSNGCTAVYAGTGRLNARQSAENFTLSELEQSIDYCHSRGVKLYVTANTLVKDNEISEFMDLMEKIYIMGADGVIVQDIGCAALIKRSFPDFYLLASTQMTIHDKAGATFLYNNGFNRIIAARELGVNELAGICEASKADIECFVHGALCFSYSGLCLMSSFIGGRSGNRGQCAQPCRLLYKLLKDKEVIAKGNLLSLKDMCGLNTLPSLINAGVKSFKIEGRMKGPEYVAAVTSVYRKYIDMYCDNAHTYSVLQEDIDTLMKVFNRSGFNDGYFNTQRDIGMLTDNKVGKTGILLGEVLEYKNRTVKFKPEQRVTAGDGIEIYAESGHRGAYITTNRDKGQVVTIKIDNPGIKKGDAIYRNYDKHLMDSLKASYEKDNRRLSINGVFKAHLNEPTVFEAFFGDIRVKKEGVSPSEALSVPLTEKEILRRLNKTGDTPFVFEHIDITVSEGLFINIAELNELRREVLDSLLQSLINSYKRSIKKTPDKKLMYVSAKAAHDTGKLAVLVKTKEQLMALSGFEPYRVYVDFPAEKSLIKQIKANEIYGCLPHIERDIFPFENNGCYDGFLIRTYGQAMRMAEQGKSFCVDYTLNIFNSYSADYWLSKGCRSVCVSPELKGEDILSLTGVKNLETVIYGKIPVMTTAQCPIGNFYGGCKQSHNNFSITSLKDKYDIITNCEMCYCLILTSKPISEETEYDYKRIEFSNETYSEVKRVMDTLKLKT